MVSLNNSSRFAGTFLFGTVFGGCKKQHQAYYRANRYKTERHQQHCTHKNSLKKIYKANRNPAMPHNSAMTVIQPRIKATEFVFLFAGLPRFFLAMNILYISLCQNPVLSRQRVAHSLCALVFFV